MLLGLNSLHDDIEQKVKKLTMISEMKSVARPTVIGVGDAGACVVGTYVGGGVGGTGVGATVPSPGYLRTREKRREGKA
jgi:hypothetical protein